MNEYYCVFIRSEDAYSVVRFGADQTAVNRGKGHAISVEQPPTQTLQLDRARIIPFWDAKVAGTPRQLSLRPYGATEAKPL